MRAMNNSSVSAGGDITGGQFAVGVSGGRVDQHMTTGPAVPADDLRAALDRLERLLGEHAGRLDEGEEARADLEDVRAQAAREKPDRRRIIDTLKRLAERVAAVGALVAAVEEVAQRLGVTL